MTAMDDYRHSTSLEVRFADLDVMGHLNHAKYLTYMEQARIMYVSEVCGWKGEWRQLGMILAKATIDYKLPVEYGDDISVYTRCSRLGSKSFDLQYLMARHNYDGQLEVVAEAVTVMVAFDYDQQQTISVPHTWRERMLAYEPALNAS